MSECVIAPGAPNSSGYKTAYLDGVRYGAHQAAWIRANGPIPPGLDVCHTCDVRACINPEHLWVGTRGDNLRDAYAKGRMTAPNRTTVVDGYVVCLQCGQNLPVSAYSPKGVTAKGTQMRQSRCRPCRAAEMLAYYHAHRTRLLALRRERSAAS